MKIISGLIVLILIAQCSCLSTSNQTTDQDDKRETTSKSNSESNKTESNNRKESVDKFAEKYRNDPESFCRMVYGEAFESIVYGNEFGNLDGYSALGFKRETVTPVNVEKLKSFDGLKPSTIESFIERNRTTEKLRDDNDVKYILKVIDEKASYEKLLADKKKDRKILAIVGLSKAGFNEDFTQSLTYVEFYGTDKLLQRKYLLVTWDIFEAGARVEETKWFSAE